MSNGTAIHLGMIGVGIHSKYGEIIYKIISCHLSIESVLARYIEKHSISSKSSFSARLETVAERVASDEWSIEACRMLNKVRNCCLHIDSFEYKNVESRVVRPVNGFVDYVSKHCDRCALHGMSNFQWAFMMVCQRLYEILNIDYDSLTLDLFGLGAELPSSLSMHFAPLMMQSNK
ncbi:hypothetical protein [Chromobacterium violaceum]|uniref:hypothetical protein n=1 Tax=Chromobacterium violaceum TaxID=536 RepID=UPI000AB755C3|nr:hypothetical protein [Chromobacterium violaceum]